MLKLVLIVLAALIVGYLAGAVGGLVLIPRLSANTHDRSVEAAMTAAFVAGPAVALVAAGVAFAVACGRSGG